MSNALDRLPPHSIEAEQGVLGCVFHSPGSCLGEALAKFKAGGEVFYDAKHRTIYESMLELAHEHVPVDPITLIARLKDRNRLDEAGGIAYLNFLPEQVLNAGNFAHYVEIVREKYLLRQALAAATELTGTIYEHSGTAQEFLAHYEQSALRLSQELLDSAEDAPVRQLVKEAVGVLEHLHAMKGQPTGITAGIPDLDRMTRGMHPAQLWVIAGRPALGKTSLTMQIAEHVGVDQGRPVGVFSLEMTAVQLVVRMICSRARVNIMSLNENGRLTQGDMEKLATAAVKIAGSKLHINDQSGLSILQLRSKARRMFQQHKIELFVIDYLGLLHSTNRKATNRQQEVADISLGVKNLAKELKVPIILLSQLNREADKEARRPQLSDLRESGAIEQDADLVGMLYKPDPKADEKAPVLPVNLFVAKHRNGPVGDVQLLFHRGHTRFESVAHGIDPKDVPQPRQADAGQDCPF